MKAGELRRISSEWGIATVWIATAGAGSGRLGTLFPNDSLVLLETTDINGMVGPYFKVLCHLGAGYVYEETID